MSPGSPGDDPIHAIFHTLWSKAVGQPGYDKDEWAELQQTLWMLQGLTPSDPLEPEPWQEGDDAG